MFSSQNIPDMGTSGTPATAVGSGKIWVAWKGEGTDTAIYWAQTTALQPDPVTGQYSFGVVNAKIAVGANTAENPALAILNGVAYLAWKRTSDNSIQWATCSDGKTWVLKSAIPNARSTKSPALTSNRQSVYLAFKGESDNAIWWATCADGNTWSVKGAIAAVGGAGAPETGEAPALASGGSAVYLAFLGVSSNRIWWSKCSDGQNWTAQKKGPAGANSSPTLTVDGNQVVWLAFVLAPNIPPSTVPPIYLGPVFFSALVDEAKNQWRPPVANYYAMTLFQPSLLSTGADNTALMLFWTPNVTSNASSQGSYPISYAPLTLPTTVFYFDLPSFVINTMRTGHLAIKTGKDTDYLSYGVQVEGHAPNNGPSMNLGDHGDGVVNVGNAPIPFTVTGYDTVIIQYTIINSSQGVSASLAFVEKAATTLYNAVQTVDFQYIETQGYPVTLLSPQESGALVGAQIGNYILPGLGAIVGALTGWFADDIWGFAFPSCDGPVATGLYTFSATQIWSFFALTKGASYIQNDDNQGGTSGAGCGANSDYVVTWLLDRPAASLQFADPTTKAAIPAPVLSGGSQFTVGGWGFPFGSIAIIFNDTLVKTVNSSDGSFIVTLTIPGGPNSNSQEITVKAIGAAGLSASLQYTTFAPPK